jgi:hypothetical protein
MTTSRFTWFGVVVELDHSETTYLIANLNTGTAGLGYVATLLAAMAIPHAAVAGAAAALVRLGVAGLGRCNSAQRGIFLYVLWVGLPWCKSR